MVTWPPFFILKEMALSAKSYIKERLWTKLIRSIPEGANEMPVKFDLMTYQALKNSCVRENHYDTEYNYVPSIRKGSVTIVKLRKVGYGESIE